MVLKELASGHNRAVFSLGANETANWGYELRCPGRSQFPLGVLHLRTWDPSGLRVIETQHRDPKSVRVYPRVEPLRRLPRPLRTQTYVGNYVAPTFGEGIELLEAVDFARRFRGAAVGAAVVTGQVRYWLRTGILGVTLGLAVSSLATGLAPALPPAAYPVLGAAGALAAFVAIARLLSRADAE